MKIRIYDHMVLNLQSISVRIRPGFSDFFNSQMGIENLQVHASNIYLFTIPAEGEITRLNKAQRQFIFQKELSLYEVQFDLSLPFDDELFDQFFEIIWHGVIYHGEVQTL